MNPDTIYAVLDLETTGTSVKNGDRIIQFGCAFLQHGQIVDTISQLVNPERGVPEAIQQLTHIHPDDLLAAPYFAELAPTLQTRLAQTVIVAHNVNFDYPFLSAEFERVGLPALTNQAVDTVELAQILMPQLGSFRLSDLTRHLQIQHDHPHRADSDAISTAKLLTTLTAQFQALPQATQALLVRLSAPLARQTGAYLQAHQTPKAPLPNGSVQVGKLILQRFATASGDPQPIGGYPWSAAAKRALFAPQLRLRKAQATMMDALYNNATVTKTPLMIEVGTGAGKTLAYLLAYAYCSDAQRQLVVATATTVLQTQIAQQVRQAAALLQQPLPAVIVKSARHFIDLQRFADTLATPHADRLTRLLQMKLVVWLTQTHTGDLSELHLTSYRAPLFARIRHRGQALPSDSAYAEYDFYHRLKAQQHAATIVITNHAYLARHATEWADQPFLVVDEAQHFAEHVAAAHARSLDFAKLRSHLQHLLRLVDHPGQHSLQAAYADSQVMRYQLQSLATTITNAIAVIEGCQQRLFRHFGHDQDWSSGFAELPLTQAQQQWVATALTAPLRQLAQQLAAVNAVCAQLVQDHASHADHFMPGDAALFQAVSALSATIAAQAGDLANLTPEVIASGAAGLCRLQLANGHDRYSLKLVWELFSATEKIQALLQHFTAPVFVGATLMVARRFDFLQQQLGLPQNTPTLHLRSPFHYRQQAQVFVDPQAPDPAQDATVYYDYLAHAIATLARGPQQTLVLFTSLAAIAAVHQRLLHTPIAAEKELLAQGVTGSAEKIAKRFALGDNSVLLGAASFFEGIDYPDKLLELVILTRLPFDAPNDPLVKARTAALKLAGQDPFTADAMPRATIRLRQSFGRLIRTEHDRGAFVVLDPRFTTTRYGRQLQHALPNLKPMALPVATIAQYVQAWLTHQPLLSKEETTHA